ncbi:MAG: PorT family protein [Prevotella sp.]|nr:PorT family protein [Prevotella sp.]
MKKTVFLTMLIAMVATAASAQFYPNGRPIPPSKRGGYSTTHHPRSHSHYGPSSTYYGFRVGLGVATVNSDSHYLDGNKAKAGLNVGLAVGTEIVPGTPLCFESGLYYTEKGGKSGSGTDKFTYQLNYLEVPLLLKYKIYTDKNISIEPFLGGYLACGVGGKIKDYEYRAAYSSFGNEYDDNFNRFDGGVKLGCGVSFDMFYLGASYDIGLANVGKDNFNDTHTGCFNLDFGITF